MEVVPLAVALGALGAVVVGPQLAQGAQRWVGARQPEDLPALLRYARPLGLAVGVLYAGAALRFGWSAALLPVLALAAGMVAVSAVDLVCWRIPTRFVYLTGGAVVAGLAVATVAAREPGSLAGSALGAGLALVLMGGLYLASPRLLGFGDVRLGVLIGLVVGWMGWRPDHPVDGPLSWTILALMVASLVGTGAGLVVLVIRHRQQRLTGRPWQEPYPFGPWLCAGGFLAILAAAPGPT